MIIDFLIYLGVVIVKFITFFCNLLPFNLQFANVTQAAFLWLLTPFRILVPFWDMSFAYSIALALLVFEASWWGYQVLIRLVHFVTLKPKEH